MKLTNVRLTSIVAGNNDRTFFDPKELQALADHIKEHGLIQPISLNQIAPGQYEIIAGERRYRATKLAGLKTIPAIIAHLTQAEASVLMLAENVSRKDLDPIDEANAYAIRIERFKWTVEDCAAAAGCSVIRVQFRLKLLALNVEIQHLIRSGNFPIGYAQILAGASLDSNRQMMAFKCYRENPRPVLGWFRNIVNQYAEQQAQASLFDGPFLSMQEEQPIDKKEIDPPHPSTTTPPIVGASKLIIIRNQINFWNEAAASWAAIGKVFKKQECVTAAQALAYAASLYR